MTDITQSPLLQKIQAAIDTHGNKSTGIRVSITKETQEIEDEKTGDIALTRALCWNLINSRKNYLTEPILAVVSSHISEDIIKKDLRTLFPNRRIIVDNDIYIDE